MIDYMDLCGDVCLYISGSQGVSSNYTIVKCGKDFNSEEELINLFIDFIDENAYENIEDYLDDCDGDEAEALGEAVADSGEFLLGPSLDNLKYSFDGFNIEELGSLA